MGYLLLRESDGRVQCVCVCVCVFTITITQYTNLGVELAVEGRREGWLGNVGSTLVACSGRVLAERRSKVVTDASNVGGGVDGGST